MYAKPDFIPSVSEFLGSDDAGSINIDALKAALTIYLLQFPQPDHFADPYDYISAMSYYDDIQSFSDIINNERTQTAQSTLRNT